MSEGEIILGIDLGTTFSLVAVVDEGGPRVLRDENGEGRVPSMMAIEASTDGPPRATVGWEARRHAVENPLATVYSVKRLIGRSYDDILADIPVLAYAVTPGPRQTVQIEIGGRRHTPEELSAVILRELRERAERQLGRSVRKAVITVPAYFDDTQRQATRDAGQAAGLEIVRILNEPTAAALAYGLGLRGRRGGDGNIHDAATLPRERGSGHRPLPMGKCRESESGGDADQSADAAPTDIQTVAVYDLGGGTFDVSILRIEDGVFQVLATAGDTRLGGDDFDRVIIDLVQREAREQLGVSIDSPATRQALRLLAESVKIRLGERAAATIELDLSGGRLYRREIARSEFESLIAPLVERTIVLLRQAITDAGVAVDAMSQVILVGGSTRVPLVRSAVERAIGRKPYLALDPDEVVALGAAVQAALLSSRPGAGGGPAGAALNMLLLDVTPLSLGIETMGGGMGKLILRNTTIPCRAAEMFTTFVDGQTAIQVRVLQGERELARDCRELALFELRGIPPMPAGIPKVEIEFLIDASGILSVSARELRSGAAANVQVIPSRGLTRDEVTRMLHDSVLHGRDDLTEHRRIDLVNQVEFDAHKTRQILDRVGHRLPPGERERIETELESLRALARESRDLDALHQALDRFGRGTIRLAELGIAEALRS